MKFAKTSSVPAITIATFAGDCDHSDLQSKMSDMSKIGRFVGDLVQAHSVPAAGDWLTFFGCDQIYGVRRI